MSHVANRCWSIGEAGDGGQRHDRVADVVHVHVDAAQRPAMYRDSGRALLHTAAHGGQDVNETEIALQTGLAQIQDRYPASGDGCSGEEVARCGGVGLNAVFRNAAKSGGRLWTE